MATPQGQMQRRAARPKESTPAPAAAREVDAPEPPQGDDLPPLCHFFTRKVGDVVMVQACDVPSQFERPKDENGEFVDAPGQLNPIVCGICIESKKMLKEAGMDPFHEETFDSATIPEDWWG